jgi:hypothetical protein
MECVEEENDRIGGRRDNGIMSKNMNKIKEIKYEIERKRDVLD